MKGICKMNYVGLDIDGVLCDWHSLIEGLFKPNDVSTKYFWKNLGRFADIQDILTNPVYYKNAPPCENAYELIKFLNDNNISYFISTNRAESLVGVTVSWLRKYLNISPKTIVYFDKNDYPLNAEFVIYIEDRVDYIPTLLELNFFVLLLNKVWNEDFSYPNRVSNLIEARDFIINNL